MILRGLIAAAALAGAVATLADDPKPAADKPKPIDGNTARPGYTPPSLVGVQGDGKWFKPRPIAFPAPDEKWVRARSAHFVILSSDTEKRTRELAEGLETLAAALTKLAPAIAAPTATPTRVLVFTRHDEVQPYFNFLLNREAANATGIFVSQKNSGAMIIDAGGGKLPSDRTPFHELVHSLMEASDKHPPLWLEEGLAEYFSNGELRSGSLIVGAPVREHVEVLHGHMLPLAQIFGVVRESDAYNLPAGQRMFYAESWAAVDSLMRASGPTHERFYDFVRDLEGGTPLETALKSRFDLTVSGFEQNVRAYGGTFRMASAQSMPVPDVDTTVSIAALQRDDLLYDLGAFLRGISLESPEAMRHFKAVLDVNPKHARALAALGRYDEAIAADPGDADIYLTYSESLLGTQIGPLAESVEPDEEATASFRKARDLAAKALTVARVDEARARGDYGTSFLVEKNDALAPGIEALQRAHALAPGRTDFAVHLFAFLRRTGDKAEQLLAQLLAARNKQVAFAARAIVVRTELARANALTHAERLDEAARVIRDLAETSDDPDVKRDFIRQAADLETVAGTNRQITLYNIAIAQVNAGKYAAARKTLTTLLASATDPSVIRDAQKLQKELAGKRDLH